MFKKFFIVLRKSGTSNKNESWPLSEVISANPTSENREIVIALNSIGKDVGFAEITSDKGHDSFLLNVPDFLNTIKNFLNTSYNKLNEKRI